MHYLRNIEIKNKTKIKQTALGLLHRRRKVLNIGGGGKVKNIEGPGSNLFAGCKVIGDITILRLELKGIRLQIPSNKIKRYIYYIKPFNLVLYCLC